MCIHYLDQYAIVTKHILLLDIDDFSEFYWQIKYDFIAILHALFRHHMNKTVMNFQSIVYSCTSNQHQTLIGS